MSKPTIEEMVDAIDQEIKNHQRFIGHEKHTRRLRATKDALLKLGEWQERARDICGSDTVSGIEIIKRQALIEDIRDFGEEGKE